jgi:predicted DNA-binding antitoxin AbrB/MazE fold protein
MSDTLRAIYRNGTFVPVVPCNLPENTPVEVHVKGAPRIQPPLEPDPIKRRKIMRELIERMQTNPIPVDAPRFTREELHERR